nr:uncharacterized protein LOC119171582 [Rhipicephalus microplus]
MRLVGGGARKARFSAGVPVAQRTRNDSVDVGSAAQRRFSASRRGGALLPITAAAQCCSRHRSCAAHRATSGGPPLGLSRERERQEAGFSSLPKPLTRNTLDAPAVTTPSAEASFLWHTILNPSVNPTASGETTRRCRIPPVTGEESGAAGLWIRRHRRRLRRRSPGRRTRRVQEQTTTCCCVVCSGQAGARLRKNGFAPRSRLPRRSRGGETTPFDGPALPRLCPTCVGRN